MILLASASGEPRLVIFGRDGPEDDHAGAEDDHVRGPKMTKNGPKGPKMTKLRRGAPSRDSMGPRPGFPSGAPFRAIELTGLPLR